MEYFNSQVYFQECVVIRVLLEYLLNMNIISFYEINVVKYVQ